MNSLQSMRPMDRGDLTYPEEDGDDDVRTGTEVTADGDSEVPGEEGKPTQQESPHHHSQCYKGLVFFSPHRTPHGSSLVRA